MNIDPRSGEKERIRHFHCFESSKPIKLLYVMLSLNVDYARSLTNKNDVSSMVV